MIESLKARSVIVILVLGASLLWTLPNFTDSLRWPSQDKLSYGLDIQGGLHLVLGIDMDKAVRDRIQKLGQTIKNQLKKEKNVELGKVEVMDTKSAKVRFFFKKPEDRKAILSYLEDQDYGQGRLFQTLQTTDQYIESHFYESQMRLFKKTLVDKSIETIRNRIDEFGVREPVIASQSDTRLLVQLPGVRDPSQAKSLINKTARLEFMIVDPDYFPGSEKMQEMAVWISELEQKEKFSLGGEQGLRYSEYIKKINQTLKDRLPQDRIIRFAKQANAKSLEAGKIPYLLQTDAMMGGETLTDALITTDQLGQPVVSFSFDAKGAGEFGELTKNNVKKQLAIVLDGVVQSAPVLREPITGGRGQIDMGSSGDRKKNMEEAKIIAMTLRSGALPAELEILEERSVGPTLGKDSIEKGQFAGLVGGLMVFLFMLFYYRVYGLLANFALACNLLMILAVLTSLQATLTLPGVAGIILTIGMAVDANVIIFERIKEELRKGAGLMGAIKEGYSRAFTAILDANITTAAVCVVLMYFGTGPIRGFAVTLIVGIITSMFTAIFLTRTLIDLMVGQLKWKINP